MCERLPCVENKLLAELAVKLTEGLYCFEFLPFYNPSASHLLGTSLYTREAVV